MEGNLNQSDHEVESAVRSEEQEQPKISPIPSLGRQSSIYSLTMGEFQNTLDNSGKSYGSMNMDEFLNSIWTAEENEVQTQNANAVVPAATAAAGTGSTNITPQYEVGEPSKEGANITRQGSLKRQGSFSVPEPMSLKTVEEVWVEINGTEEDNINFPLGGSKQRKTTYGEMTLEDFLVKAGVVREEVAAPLPPQPQPQPQPQPESHFQTWFQPQLQPQPQPQPQPHLLPQSQPLTQPPTQPLTPPPPYGVYQNCDSSAASSFMAVGCGGVGSVSHTSAFTSLPQSGGVNVVPCLPGENSSVNGYQQPGVNNYGGRATNGKCGIESFGQLSPVSSDGIDLNKPGQRRRVDRPAERVIERRQKRMIKNRESAARSRARKHAYTLELEAELTTLREHNAYLRQRLAEAERRLQQQELEAARARAQEKAKDKQARVRSNSCPF